MEQDTNDDKAVADFLTQENRAENKREQIEVDKRNRNNEVVGIRDCANGPQDQ
jgi:hypothetical protein